MSNAFASHFERIGMTADEARSRAALFQELEDRGGTVLNGRPQWYRFSPGRIEIFGKHTDYAGGHSLLAAVPRGIALVARPRTDGMVRVGDVRDRSRATRRHRPGVAGRQPCAAPAQRVDATRLVLGAREVRRHPLRHRQPPVRAISHLHRCDRRHRHASRRRQFQQSRQARTRRFRRSLASRQQRHV